jgi:hypothetical protein
MGENKPTAEEFVSLKESVLIIITNILNSASSLKLIPIKILMDKKAYISNKTKRFVLIEAFFKDLFLIDF